jgi:hypothetical protein
MAEGDSTKVVAKKTYRGYSKLEHFINTLIDKKEEAISAEDADIIVRYCKELSDANVDEQYKLYTKMSKCSNHDKHKRNVYHIVIKCCINEICARPSLLSVAQRVLREQIEQERQKLFRLFV